MVKSKQRSKPLKSPAFIIKNKGKRELPPVGKELLNHCKNRQPVFLHGEYKDREDLFRDVHSAIDNNNIDADREYVDDDGNPTTREKLQDKFKEIYESKGLKELDFIKQEIFLFDHFKSTARTRKYVDCGAMSAKEVYIELVINAEIIGKAEIDGESKKLLDKYMSMDIGRISEDELRRLQGNDSLIDITAFSDAKELQNMLNGKIRKVEPVYKGYLFQRKGNLFIDNLHYDPDNKEDEKYYRLLAKIIEDRALGSCSTTFNWLVVYTHDDPKDFDNYFLEAFEPISLDRKEVVVESATETYKDEQRISYPVPVEVNRHSGLLKRNGKESKMKLLPIQLRLLKLLYDKKDTLIERSDIYTELWGVNTTAVYEVQITDHINKLRNAFKEIGFKKEVIKKKIIETVTESKWKKGGYIFHSNMVSLVFD